MSGRTKPSSHSNVSQVEWTARASYPEALRRVVHWKTLIGRGGPAWLGVPHKDVVMGILALDAGDYSPAHAHPAPEISFVMSGTAEWTVGEETFTAEPGTAIYHPSHVLPRMVNNTTAPLRTVWFWWAPDGHNDVLQVGPTLLASMPGVPPQESGRMRAFSTLPNLCAPTTPRAGLRGSVAFQSVAWFPMGARRIGGLQRLKPGAFRLSRPYNPRAGADVAFRCEIPGAFSLPWGWSGMGALPHPLCGSARP